MPRCLAFFLKNWGKLQTLFILLTIVIELVLGAN